MYSLPVVIQVVIKSDTCSHKFYKLKYLNQSWLSLNLSRVLLRDNVCTVPGTTTRVLLRDNIIAATATFT